MNNTNILPTILVCLFVGLVIVVGYFAAQEQKKRQADLLALAERLGFTFFEEGIPLGNPAGLLDLFGFASTPNTCPYSADFVSFFPLFDRGSARRIRPALVGTDPAGNGWFLFDYQYTVSTGKNSTTYRFSVVVAQTQIALPTLTLSPENVGYSVGKFFGMQELQVESEDFNKRYFIKTSDNKMALDLLHPVAIETLLCQPAFEWQMAGPFVMLHLHRHISGDEYEGLMGCVQDFLRLVPAFYRQDHSGARV